VWCVVCGMWCVCVCLCVYLYGVCVLHEDCGVWCMWVHVWYICIVCGLCVYAWWSLLFYNFFQTLVAAAPEGRGRALLCLVSHGIAGLVDPKALVSLV